MSHLSDRATIVIPVHNQVSFTRICLASMEREQGGAEVIVVDNGSTDGTPAVLAKWSREGPRRRFLRHDQNVGFARGCNSGAEQAAGEFTVFLNNDIFLLEGWLENLLRPFQDPSVAVTGSRLLYPSGHIQHAGVAFTEAGPFHLFMGLPGDLPPALEQRDFQVVTGASLAIRTEEFRALGGFDTSYRNSYEDVDLCLRVRQRGGRVVYVPDSVAYHFESMTEGRLDETDTRNYDLFISRWRGHFECDLPKLEAEAVASGVDLRRDRVQTRRERVDQERGAQAELEQLRREVRQLREEADGLGSVRQELERLRHLAQMRSVRAALWARNAFRRVVPS